MVRSLTLFIFLITATSAQSRPDIEELRIDPSASKMVVNVGRSGVFGFAGHDHEVAVTSFSGRVSANRSDLAQSKLTMEFDATTMKVTGKGEPAKDVPEVQRVMMSDKVLDVERYPKITFASDRVEVVQKSAESAKLRIHGQLTLHGTKKAVVVPVDVKLTGDGITANGRSEFRQTTFGIKPVTAGGGTVKVKDEVEIVFTMVAKR
jgi:polyisoprenoid-binding protein YceI